MVRTVIFDLDGTLLNTLADLTDSVNAALAHFSCPPVTEEDVRTNIGNGAGRLLEGIVPLGRSHPSFEAILSWYVAYYQSHCRIKTAPYEGIMPLLTSLKSAGVPMAIVSNKGDGAVKELAAQYFPGLLEAAVGEMPGVRRKPAPDAVLKAMDLCGGTIRDTLYVGDSEVDLATANNASLPCALVTWGFRAREALAALQSDYLIDRPAQLLDIIRGIR